MTFLLSQQGLSKAFLLATAILSSTYAAAPPESSHVVEQQEEVNLSSNPLSPGVDFLQSNPPSTVLSSTFPTPQLHLAYEEWKIDFSKSYATVHENAYRKLIWLENHVHITKHNNNREEEDAKSKKSKSYTLAHNDFSDLTNDEFQQRFYLGKYSPGVMKPRGRSDGKSSIFRSGISTTSDQRKLLSDNTAEVAEEENIMVLDDNVPDYKNWTEEGAVTKVKNQWFCGACWAFSAVGAIEGARYINTGNLTELSMQQLIDCDLTDLGCGGGLMDQAFQYDEDSVGLCSLSEYPYAFHRHWFYGCRRYMPYCTPLSHTKVSKFVDVEKSEVGLTNAIAKQPVSVAVYAGNGLDWQFYGGGIYDKGCEGDIDHGVLAVGYGHYDPSTDPNAKSDSVAGDYWLIKNSWGERWGMNGYIQLGRGLGNEEEGGSSCVLQLSSRPIMMEDDP
eukprot:CAMPEP_0183707062 /NCGR_PEP_ID=MMETSP0737-20130205/3737_1 /TAXON_ID=385413 /ORGANISM="Thalassiosira miniscula, Strain CCMP1093" /LENGTH=445 /DNA_ID=CAMNT_0025934637 /DNA_START=105 /DNA_END=1442 /DNA_ORIENTATION=-